MHSPNSVESEICYLKFRHCRNLVWSFGLVLQNRSHTLWLCQNSWLVVLTVFKNISQWEGLSHILWKKCSKPPNRKWPSRNSWISQKKTGDVPPFFVCLPGRVYLILGNIGTHQFPLWAPSTSTIKHGHGKNIWIFLGSCGLSEKKPYFSCFIAL